MRFEKKGFASFPRKTFDITENKKRRCLMKKTKMFVGLVLLLVLVSVLPADESSDCKPNCTPQVQSKPYPEDPIAAKTVPIALNMEPRFFWKNGQEEAAQKKLADYKKKFGKSPNILIFLMDDVGWGDPGCYGGGITVGAPTPNMDSLARAGLKLTSTYAQPSCSPTRATILTGRLPMRTGITIPSAYGSPLGLKGVKGNFDEITLAELLKKTGYVTQAVGKWHLGEKRKSQPQNVGFDNFYGFLCVSEVHTEWRDPYFNPDMVNHRERYQWVCNLDFNHFLVEGIGPKPGQTYGELKCIEEIDIDVSKQLDDRWADYSVKFIESMKGKEKPFFLYHCTRGLHYDNYPSDQWSGSSPAGYQYKDCMVQIDAILGRLVKALEESGQLENTLIFVTSDNGPEMGSWWDSGYTPFRGGKGSTWEGGVRVPGIAYWKGMITPGRESDGLFDLADLFNTSLALAGASQEIPGDRYIDGIDQTSFLLADNGLSNRKYVYYWLTNTFSAIRSGEYKRMSAATYTESLQDMWNPGGFNGALTKFSYGKLFNLYLDPKETHDYLNRKGPIGGIYLSKAVYEHMQTFTRYPPKVSQSPFNF
jgi:arylsulfatase A-like enzyme